MHTLHKPAYKLFEGLKGHSRRTANGIMSLMAALVLLTVSSRAADYVETYHSFEGKTTGVTVNYALILPDGYETSGKEYPVIYFLHGLSSAYNQSGDDHDYVAGAIESGLLEPMIIVAPDGYDNTWWMDESAERPAESNFIIELIPYIEEHYRVKKGPAYRLLTGFSMGGHGAFYFAVKYPDMFCATFPVDAAMRSSTNYTQYIDRVRKHQPKIYNVGARLCGDRHEKTINEFRELGVEFPYVYVDQPHYYPSIILADKNMGFVFLQSQLGASSVAVRMVPARSAVPQTFNTAANVNRTVVYLVNGRAIASPNFGRNMGRVEGRLPVNRITVDPSSNNPKGCVTIR